MKIAPQIQVDEKKSPKGSMGVKHFFLGYRSNLTPQTFELQLKPDISQRSVGATDYLRKLWFFHSKLPGGKPGKPSQQQKSMKKTQTELLHQEVHVPEKLPQAGGYDAACFFVGGLTVKTDVMCSSFIQIDLLISLKLGKDHLWVQTRSFWRTWLLLLLSNIVW